jgi:hypothetical protein
LTLPLYHPVFPATVDDAINDLWKKIHRSTSRKKLITCINIKNRVKNQSTLIACR